MTILQPIGEIVKTVGGIVDSVITTDEERMELKLKMTEILEKYDAQQKESVAKIVASEMASGDKYVSRARPSLLYFFIFFISVNWVLIPLLSFFGVAKIPEIRLPNEIWQVFMVFFSIYAVGRSTEKITGENILTGIKTKIKGTENAYRK